MELSLAEVDLLEVHQLGGDHCEPLHLVYGKLQILLLLLVDVGRPLYLLDRSLDERQRRPKVVGRVDEELQLVFGVTAVDAVDVEAQQQIEQGGYQHHIGGLEPPCGPERGLDVDRYLALRYKIGIVEPYI